MADATRFPPLTPHLFNISAGRSVFHLTGIVAPLSALSTATTVLMKLSTRELLKIRHVKASDGRVHKENRH